jgi:SpoVK/Ycf46/Vps4 family AAA+-type ATPase
MPLAPDVDLPALAARTPRYTGAELAAVCREAALGALREDPGGASCVAKQHFEAAVAGVRPSLSEAALARYAAWPPRRGGAAAAAAGE